MSEQISKHTRQIQVVCGSLERLTLMLADSARLVARNHEYLALTGYQIAIASGDRDINRLTAAPSDDGIGQVGRGCEQHLRFHFHRYFG